MTALEALRSQRDDLAQQFAKLDAGASRTLLEGEMARVRRKLDEAEAGE